MPGPPVAVCEGDLVIVEVNNHLHTETTTMHFHGTHLCRKTKLDFINCIFFKSRRTFSWVPIHGWNALRHPVPNFARVQVFCQQLCNLQKIGRKPKFRISDLCTNSRQERLEQCFTILICRFKEETECLGLTLQGGHQDWIQMSISMITIWQSISFSLKSGFTL